MICPYCEQGRVLNVKVRKNGKEIYICEECDTVWEETVDLLSGIDFEMFMKEQGCAGNWNELEEES